MADARRTMGDLATEVLRWSKITNGFSWDKSGDDLVLDPTNTGAKPITKGDWLGVMKIAADIFESRRFLGVPEPVAHPEYGAGLCWRESDTHFVTVFLPHGRGDAAVRGELSVSLRWERVDDVGRHSGSTLSVRELRQMLESTFAGRAPVAAAVARA